MMIAPYIAFTAFEILLCYLIFLDIRATRKERNINLDDIAYQNYLICSHQEDSEIANRAFGAGWVDLSEEDWDILLKEMPELLD